MSKQTMMENIVNKVINDIDKHGKNWLKPWSSLGMPINILSRNQYRGINVIALWIAKTECGFNSNHYGTFNQIRQKGGVVKKGQTGTQVIFMQPALYRDARKGETPDKKDGSVQVQYNLMRSYFVFNMDQAEATNTKLVYNKKTKKYDVESCDLSEFENLKKSLEVKPDGANDLDHVDQYIKNTKAEIKYNQTLISGCFYVPSQDYIGMVPKERFNNGKDGSSATQNFYATILHELTHWTGHKSRCDRDERYKAKYYEKFSSKEKYAFEELVAELGACIQCCMLGITMEPTPHAIQYLKIWKDRIKDKPETIFKASALAQAGVSYIENLQPENMKKAS